MGSERVLNSLKNYREDKGHVKGLYDKLKKDYDVENGNIVSKDFIN